MAQDRAEGDRGHAGADYRIRAVPFRGDRGVRLRPRLYYRLAIRRMPPPNDAPPIGTRVPVSFMVRTSNVAMSFDSSLITYRVLESGENTGKPWPVSFG